MISLQQYRKSSLDSALSPHSDSVFLSSCQELLSIALELTKSLSLTRIVTMMIIQKNVILILTMNSNKKLVEYNIYSLVVIYFKLNNNGI